MFARIEAPGIEYFLPQINGTKTPDSSQRWGDWCEAARAGSHSAWGVVNAGPEVSTENESLYDRRVESAMRLAKKLTFLSVEHAQMHR